MQTSDKIKKILYNILENYSEKEIQKFVQDKKTSKFISQILAHCYPKLTEIKNSTIDEKAGILAEGMLHYLLTNLLIPSQRKIIQKGIEIDLAIPDLKRLAEKPDDSLIICFPKTCNLQIIEKRLDELQQVQPIRKNIWIVLHEHVESPSNTYSVKEVGSTFPKIIDDIEKFLSTKEKIRFKIFKT